MARHAAHNAHNSLMNSVPPSKDTIFLRGFSARHHVDDIRDFFARGGARNTVEFFKADDTLLWVALRFETKDIAKDIIARYDNKDILGDRVQMSYYKDLRRTKFRRPMGGQHEYDYRYDGRGDRRNDYGSGGWRGGDSYAGGRNRPGMWGGHYQQQQQQQAVASRTRRYTRSSSHSRSPSRSNTRSSSSSAAPSPSRRKHRHRSMSGGRRNKSPKRKSGHAKRRAAQSSQSPDRASTPASNTERRKSKGRKGASTGGEGTEDRSPSAEWRARQGETSAALSDSNAEVEEERKKVDESSVDGGAAASDINEAGESTAAKAAVASRGQRNLASDKKRKVIVTRTAEDDKQEDNDDEDIISHNTGKASKSRKQPKDISRRHADVDLDHSNDNDDDNSEDDKIVAANKGPLRKSKDEEYEAGTRAVKSLAGKDGLLNEDDVNMAGGDSRSAVKRKKLMKGNSGQSDVEPSDQELDEELEQQVSSRKRKKGDQSTGLGRRGHAAELAAPNGRDMDRGSAQTLSQQKLALIREKKDEIEKAYRQDCETFATVSKMLISKDQDLEDKIQKSLSENLKDIGQRCIQELREFVERLKADDDLI